MFVRKVGTARVTAEIGSQKTPEGYSDKASPPDSLANAENQGDIFTNQAVADNQLWHSGNNRIWRNVILYSQYFSTKSV